MILSFSFTFVGFSVNRSISLAANLTSSTREVIEWARRRAPTHTGLRNLLLELDSSYEILFIPGLMGSRLQIGDFVWGEDKVEAEKLLLDDSRPAIPSMLYTFQARDQYFGLPLKRKDIYGLGLLKFQDALEGRQPLEYAYDWRLDIDFLADQFQDYSREHLKGKKLIIVAHSMGGLLAWHWKNKYRSERPFTLVTLVLLGTPLQGTCEIAVQLVGGYTPYEGGLFAKLSYKLVFGDARAAVFSFPSVFSLLPRNSRCVVIEQDDRLLEQNLLELEFWKTKFRNDFEGFAENVGMQGESHEERKLAYEKKVKAALEQARRFRYRFDPRQYDDSVYFLYSTKFNMPIKYILKERHGHTVIEGLNGKNIVKGDGRVPESSAIHEGYREPPLGHIYKLQEGHGELLSDRDFVGFVVTELKAVVERAKALEIGVFAEHDPELRNELIKQGVLISPDPVGISPAAFSKEERTRIALLNEETIRSYLGDKPIVLSEGKLLCGSPSQRVCGAKHFGRYLEDVKKNTKAARVLYASAHWIASEGTDARTLNRLGFILLREGKYNAAAAVLLEGARKAETTTDPYLTQEIKGKVYGNLGAAYEHAGFVGKAAFAYEEGANLGNTVARWNFERLQKP